VFNGHGGDFQNDRRKIPSRMAPRPVGFVPMLPSRPVHRPSSALRRAPTPPHIPSNQGFNTGSNSRRDWICRTRLADCCCELP